MNQKKLLHGWEVEWCTDIPLDEFGNSDFDNADYCVRDFTTAEAARRFAKSMLPKDKFGSVRINEFQMEPYEEGCPPLCREYVGQQEYIES